MLALDHNSSQHTHKQVHACKHVTLTHHKCCNKDLSVGHRAFHKGKRLCISLFFCVYRCVVCVYRCIM